MERQRKNMKMKKKEESSEKELKEIEASNLPNIEFKVVVITMLKELSENYKELNGNYISMKTLNKNSWK